jgi:hypothetical protein
MKPRDMLRHPSAFPLSPRQGAITLALQAGPAAVALLPVDLLRW